MSMLVAHRCGVCERPVKWHKRLQKYVHADYNRHDHEVADIITVRLDGPEPELLAGRPPNCLELVHG